MVRGAQSAGLVTYVPQRGSHVGLRSRVVNGKRTDLSTLLLNKFERDLRWAEGLGRGDGGEMPRLFQGHTRFATSSICNLSGCHPHQWVPPSTQARESAMRDSSVAHGPFSVVCRPLIATR